MKALLFGGSGFVGRASARLLIDSGWTVDVADSMIVKPEGALPPAVRFQWMDVRYHSQVEHAIVWSEPDVVVWLAARQGYGDDWRSFAAVNVGPMYGLAELMRRAAARGVVLASSQAVYAPVLEASEDSPRVPPSCYGLSKLQGEEALRHFALEVGFRVVALRPSIILGRGQSMDGGESGVLRNWARAVRGGGRPEIYGSGEQVRDFVHVEDVARGVVLACWDAAQERAGSFKAVNLGGVAESILGLWRRFQEAFPGTPGPEVLGRGVRPGGEFDLTSSSALAGKLWGWRPEVGLERQVRDFAEGLRG